LSLAMKVLNQRPLLV